jgi:Mrp family chromosome partitioning ATPase
MNFRNPGIAAALGIPPHGDMAAFLAGEVPLSQQLQRLSESLAVGSNCHPDHNASDILHDRRAADVISTMIDETQADTVLFDLPPVLEHDDVTAFLPQVDGVLLISDGDRTTAAELAACEKMLAGHAPLLGVVLNKAQQSDKTQVTP